MQLEITSYLDLLDTIKPSRYLEFLTASQEVALDSIKTRLRAGRKIRIGIQFSGVITWTGDDLVKLFLADSRFQTEVVLIWENVDERNTEEGEPILTAFAKVVQESGLPYRIANGSVSPAEYDILIYLLPYWYQFANFTPPDIPLTTLLCYIAYGFCNTEDYAKFFNLNFHNTLWKNFQFTKEAGVVAAEHCAIASHGMVYTGYPKLDQLLDKNLRNKAKWKIAAGQDPAKVKKIIWAPHHTLTGDYGHSTFADNYEFMLLFAYSHPEYSFFFKPHPRLEVTAVEAGLFADTNAYYLYLSAWENLPNASFGSTEYLPYFQSSDALITDCDSFITEYLYVDKPCLFLRKDTAKFNRWGELCLENYYQVKGSDHAGIEHFLKELIDTDPKKEERHRFYREHLDYYHATGRTAAESVYHAIADEFDDVRRI